MPSNRDGEIVQGPIRKGWLHSLRRLSLVRLLVLFGVLLAGDIAAQLLTGGKFGPEASLMAIAVCLAAAVLLLISTVPNGGWISMQRVFSHS